MKTVWHSRDCNSYCTLRVHSVVVEHCKWTPRYERSGRAYHPYLTPGEPPSQEVSEEPTLSEYGSCLREFTSPSGASSEKYMMELASDCKKHQGCTSGHFWVDIRTGVSGVLGGAEVLIHPYSKPPPSPPQGLTASGHPWVLLFSPAFASGSATVRPEPEHAPECQT